MNDPIVEEVRKHRAEHTKQFKGDMHLICEALRELESTLKDRMVAPKPKRIQPR